MRHFSKNSTKRKRPKRNSSSFIVTVKEKPFRDIEKVKSLTVDYIQKQETKSAGIADINYYIIQSLTSSDEEAIAAINIKDIRDYLSVARRELKYEGIINHHSEKKCWYLLEDSAPVSNTTLKEKSFLKYKGHGEGWSRINHELDAIDWIYKNFSHDEFEKFCCALLRHCGVYDVDVTPKRKSGADGGLDGIGLFVPNDHEVKIAFEAKKYQPDAQIGTDVCQKLFGAMSDKHIRYGFLITTAKISQRVQKLITNYETSYNVYIHAIDRKEMARIMLEKGDGRQGLGLLKTDIGFVYMNKEILRQSISS